MEDRIGSREGFLRVPEGQDVGEVMQAEPEQPQWHSTRGLDGGCIP